MKSKTIIISPQNEENENQGRGILTLHIEDELLQCKLRLYNTPKLNRFCKLGVYHQNEVFSSNLLEKSGSYTSSLVGDFNIDKDFYVAIVDTSNNNHVLLAGGTYAGCFFNDQSDVFLNIEKENPNTNIFNYEDEQNTFAQNNIELETTGLGNDNICSESNCNADKCLTCKYKEFFYSHQNDLTEEFENFQDISTASQPSLENKENDFTTCQTVEQSERILNTEQNELKINSQDNTILSALVPQFQYVFENYPEDETLTTLIPNSKFVKINENKEQYSIGAIYENEQIKVICYAVLKDYNTPAPQELGEHYQWLPLDKEDPLSEGYYIVFQDANDLKIVEI